MTVRQRTSGAVIVELEKQAVSCFSAATTSAADGLATIYAIKESGEWRNHVYTNEDGSTEPVWSDFAREYLPEFMRRYANVIGVDFSPGWVLARFRLYETLRLAEPAATWENVLALNTSEQYALEQMVKKDKSSGEPRLLLAGQGPGSEEAATELVRGVLDGTVSIEAIRSELPATRPWFTVPASGRQLQVVDPNNGTALLGRFDNVPPWAWLALVRATNAKIQETGEE